MSTTGARTMSTTPTPTPTRARPVPPGPRDFLARVRALFEDEAMTATMTYLAGRWADERGLEALADYATPVQEHAKRYGLTVGPMLSRPFGAEVRDPACPGCLARFTVTLAGAYRYVYRVTLPR